MDELRQLFALSDPLTWKTAIVCLLLAFVLALALATVYVWTFRGMSYSRSFVHAVATGSIVAAMLMLAINNSIAAGLGIAGSLAVIRFRTAMRDPRDMLFVFASMGAGIAAGLRAFAAAIAGTVVFCLVSIVITGAGFGSQRQYDGLLRLQLPVDTDSEQQLAELLRKHTRSFVLVTLREVAQGEAMVHAYQVRFGRQGDRLALLHALDALPRAQDISLMLQEPTVEI